MYIGCIFAELKVHILVFGLVDLRTSGPSDWWTFGLVGSHQRIFSLFINTQIMGFPGA
jgi:hypothetical protein